MFIPSPQQTTSGAEIERVLGLRNSVSAFGSPRSLLPLKYSAETAEISTYVHRIAIVGMFPGRPVSAGGRCGTFDSADFRPEPVHSGAFGPLPGARRRLERVFFNRRSRVSAWGYRAFDAVPAGPRRSPGR